MGSETRLEIERDPRTQAVWDWLDGARSEENEGEIAAYIVENWPASRGVRDAWLQTHPHTYVGPLLATHALRVPEIKSEELLSTCLYFADETEVIPLLRKADAKFRNYVATGLEPHAKYVLLRLFGRKWTWSDRLFGPGLDALLFGARGFIGPPGVVGGLVAVGAYQIQTLSFVPFFGLWGLVFITVRALILKDIAPTCTPNDFDQSPLDREIVRWAVRERHAQGLPDSAALRQWQIWLNSSALPEESEPDSPSLGSNPLELYELRETSEPMTRERAWKTLEALAEARETPVHWLILEGMSARPELMAPYLEELKGYELGFSVGFFRAHWLEPPSLQVAQRVLWGEFNGYGELVQEFRVDESAECVDLDDEPVKFGLHTQILAIPPRCEISPEWAQVFADFEIVEAIWQLEAVELSELERVDEASLMATGYLACAPEPGLEETIYLFRKPLPEVGQTIYIELESGIGEGQESDAIHAMTLSEGVHYLEPEVLSAPREVPPGIKAVELRRLLWAQKTRVPTSGS